MAASKPSNPLDMLEQLIGDVLVQTGKALKANSKSGKRTASLSNMGRIYDSNERFNAVLDDIESDIVRAKAVLQRDLEKLRAKNKPPEPEPPAIPQAPLAPMIIDLDSPKMANRPLPVANRPTKPDSKPMAPFPNMGMDVPKVPSPQSTMKIKAETRSPQPATNPGVQAVKGAMKAPSPAAKVASPAMKTTSPAMKTASPAMKTASLVVKAASPAVKNTPTATKAGSPVITTPKPTPKPTPPPAAATPVPVAPMTTPVPTTMATPPVADASLSSLFNLGGSASGPTQMGNPELNFTDMQFSLAPPSDEPQPQTQPDDEEIDLSAFTQDLMPSDAFLSGDLEQAEMAPVDSLMQSGDALDVTKQPEPVPDADMDDLFDLNGTSMDLGMDDGDADNTNTNFNELFYDAEDTEMGDIDSFFRIDDN